MGWFIVIKLLSRNYLQVLLSIWTKPRQKKNSKPSLDTHENMAVDPIPSFRTFNKY